MACRSLEQPGTELRAAELQPRYRPQADADRKRYAAYATSSNPVGSEFDGTSAQDGGFAPSLNGNPNQIFGPEKNKAIEIGTKWELFDRRLLLTAALFQTEKENARESQNIAQRGVLRTADVLP